MKTFTDIKKHHEENHGYPLESKRLYYTKLAWDMQEVDIKKLTDRIKTLEKYREEPYQECIRLQNLNCKHHRKKVELLEIIKCLTE